jgi:hypothetical protein
MGQADACRGALLINLTVVDGFVIAGFVTDGL